MFGQVSLAPHGLEGVVAAGELLAAPLVLTESIWNPQHGRLFNPNYLWDWSSIAIDWLYHFSTIFTSMIRNMSHDPHPQIVWCEVSTVPVISGKKKQNLQNQFFEEFTHHVNSPGVHHYATGLSPKIAPRHFPFFPTVSSGSVLLGNWGGSKFLWRNLEHRRRLAGPRAWEVKKDTGG